MHRYFSDKDRNYLFHFFGKDRREPHQQKKGINRKFQGEDHIKHFTKQIINRAIIIAGFRNNAEVLKKDSADTKKPPVGGFLCTERGNYRSIARATPCPPPIQSVAIPFRALRFFISWTSDTRMRQPEAPMG